MVLYFTKIQVNFFKISQFMKKLFNFMNFLIILLVLIFLKVYYII